MPLLERQTHLDRMRQRFDAVAADRGACVVLSGEAGIGKTALLRAFTQALPATTTVLACGCEALFTPRPLGPLIDLASRFPPSVEHALHEGRTYNGLFPALLAFLRDAARPRVLVIEDMHWADVGTIDFVRYLARRVHELPLLLVLSHRDEALDAGHPLARLLGELPAAHTLRIELPPLSAQAVVTLAQGRTHRAAEVYAATAGNPFYVTELLAAPDTGVPPSVRDAVLATLARLSPAARDLARAVSLLPGHADLALLHAMGVDAARETIDECLRVGILVARERGLAFRHEITRNAVRDAMPAHDRARGHAAAYRAWYEQGASADEHGAHRMHHAEAAGLTAQAAALAPLAARRAATTGDHREAARLYRIALDHNPHEGADPDDAARAALLEALADELTLVNRHRDAIDAREAALAIHTARDDRLRVGVTQRGLARLHWFDAGGQGQAPLWAQRAIDTLEPLARTPRPGSAHDAGRATRELALAYSTMSHLCLVREDMHGASTWGLRAIELAEPVEDAEAMCHALNNVACAILRQRDDALAWERLARSLAIAREHRLSADAARAFNNLFILSVVHHALDQGLRWAREGLDYCEAQGLDVYAVRILIRRAFAHIVAGRWDDARADLAEVERRHTPSPMEAATHAFVSSLLARRTGEPDAPARLERSIDAMLRHEVEIWFISTAAARAEAAWLDGDLDRLHAHARAGLEQTLAVGDRWRTGELAAWLRRAAGRDPTTPADPYDLHQHLDPRDLPAPYEHELAGRWREAGQAWAALGCPYDRALALTAGDDAALTEALAIFETLGARAAAERVRTMLRDRGVRGVPRGPMPRTRDDPLNLTARERQIFDLLRQGASNAAIAAQLHRSERTIEHHVSALLRKLGVRGRVELMARFAGGAGTG